MSIQRSFRLDSRIVKKIKTCDTQGCWDVVKDYIATDVLGEKMIPIPYLSEAERYDLNAVIMVKRNNVFQNLFRMKKKALPVDVIQEMIRSEVPIADSINMTRPVKINSRFRRITTIYGSKGKSAFVIQITGLSQYQLHHLPNDVLVDITPYFEEFHTNECYIITKVIYAEDFRLRVLVDNKFDDFRPRCRIPIGFQLTKLQILYNSVIGNNEPVREKMNVRWVKFSQTIIPRTLLVERDNRGGGDDGKRRHGPRNVAHNSIYRDLNDSSSDGDDINDDGDDDDDIIDVE